MVKIADKEAEEGTFLGFDGEELYFQTWPVKDPKAIVIGIHGLGEHSGSYERLAQGLVGVPVQLIMSDLRGHGQSAGKRGIGTIDEFVLDMKLFVQDVKSRYAKLPIFFLGHSMGGLILLKLLIRNGNFNALGAVLSSPFLAVTVEIPPLKKKSAGFLAKVLPNIALGNEIPNKNLTHDQSVIEEYEADHLRHDRISPGLFANMQTSQAYVIEQGDKLNVPLFMQQAGDDRVVSQKKAEEFFDKLKLKDKEKIVYEGFFHEIYNEVNRAKPFADLKRWLERKLNP